jgi:4-hydroxy-tetrahydrodipicolinate reductase
MRIALIGYGKMGRRIAELAPQRGHIIAHQIGLSNRHELEKISDCDVAIEFTNPKSAVQNYRDLFEIRIPVVSGTTGWYSHLREVEELAQKEKAVFFYASNFSIGVQISLAASNYIAHLMNRFDGYAAKIEEWHHTAKKDAPSGTAITFAEGLQKNNKKYSNWKLVDSADTDKDKESLLPISAYRENEIPGTHKITWSSEIDTISIEHTALNRDGFALGAIAAAEFAVNAIPGVYTMNDLMNLQP